MICVSAFTRTAACHFVNVRYWHLADIGSAGSTFLRWRGFSPAAQRPDLKPPDGLTSPSELVDQSGSSCLLLRRARKMGQSAALRSADDERHKTAGRCAGAT